MKLLEDILSVSDELVTITQDQVYMILSLQDTVERIDDGIWKVKEKKKYGGNLNISKISNKYFK